jgi:phage terminase large subunit GpA-like protein
MADLFDVIFDRYERLTFPPQVTPDAWAMGNRSYHASSAIPGRRDPLRTPYNIMAARAMMDSDFKRIVLVEGAQSGKTESCLDVVGATLDTRPAPIVYVGPTRDFVSDIFEPRLMALFDEAPGLAQKLSRGKKNKKTSKLVSGVPIRLAWAGSTAQLKSFSCLYSIVDEYDEMGGGLKDQGSVLNLVEARSATYGAAAKTFVTSTPSRGVVETELDEKSGLTFWKPAPIENVSSPIWRLWQSGTRHHWSAPCVHCGVFFIPMFKHLSWPEGASPAQAKKEAHLTCPSCGCALFETDKQEMNARGLFVAPGMYFNEGGELCGEPEDNSTLSMWVSGLMSPFQSFGDRAEAYLKALASGDAQQLQTTMNACFGEVMDPLTASVGVMLEWENVAAKCGAWGYGEVHPDARVITAGVDVQGNRLVYEVRAFGANQSSWQVEAGELYGNTKEQAVWDQLHELLTRDWQGRRIASMFIDAGFNTDQVYEFARLRRGRVWPVKGVSTNLTGKMIRPSKVELRRDGRAAMGSIELINIGTNMAKSWIFSRLSRENGAPGSWMLAASADEFYCRQIVAEVCVEKRPGVYEWVRRDRDNHFLDACVYALCAAMHWGLMRHGATRTTIAAPDTPPPAPAAPPPPARAQQPAPNPFGGLPPTTAPPPRQPSSPQWGAQSSSAVFNHWRAHAQRLNGR